MKQTLIQWLKSILSVAMSMVMLLLALFAIYRIGYPVGYGYDFLSYPHTGVLHEFHYMQPYVLELRILTNLMIVVGTFCYFLRFSGAFYLFALVLLVKLLDTWIPTIFSGRVLFVPGEWPYKFVPTVFWLTVLVAVYIGVKKDKSSRY